MDTFNKFGVGVVGDDVAVVFPPRGRLTREDAMMLAAWLVTMAQIGTPRNPAGNTLPPFEDFLKAVQS